VKVFWGSVMFLLGAGTLLLAWHGVKNVAQGLEGSDPAAPNSDMLSVFLILGVIEVVGALLGLYGLYRFARTWRLLPGRDEHVDASAAIHARAIANLNAARGQGK